MVFSLPVFSALDFIVRSIDNSTRSCVVRVRSIHIMREAGSQSAPECEANLSQSKSCYTEVSRRCSKAERRSCSRNSGGFLLINGSSAYVVLDDYT